MKESQLNLEDKKTIQDFGEQWTRYQENDGYYASKELFIDICGPLLSVDSIKDKKVAEIGSGSGRIVQMLIDCGVESILALEPSEAFQVLKKNTEHVKDKIEYMNVTGEEIPADSDVDYIFSIGVLHHISEPNNVIRSAYNALKKDGKILIWLYGYEGNETYLRFVNPLRKITVLVPHPILALLCHGLNILLDGYIYLCNYFKLPLYGYIKNVLGKISRKKRYLVIYDQLNPKIAKYYKENEARLLLEKNGFNKVKLFHRHGYSWSVIGEK